MWIFSGVDFSQEIGREVGCDIDQVFKELFEMGQAVDALNDAMRGHCPPDMSINKTFEKVKKARDRMKRLQKAIASVRNSRNADDVDAALEQGKFAIDEINAFIYDIERKLN